MLKLDLIELDEAYYTDVLYFKDPDGLNQIFDDLEEKNLSNINKLQEVEQALEAMEEKRIEISTRLEGEKSKQEESQTKISKVIRDALTNLDNIQKNTTGTQVLEKPTIAPANGKPPVAKPVDFDKLVDELHGGICKIWRKLEDNKVIKKEGAEVQNKDPVDILNVTH
jgi:hypothetical protein